MDFTKSRSLEQCGKASDYSGLINSFQLKSALWEGKPLSFRDRAFKQCRYTVFAEEHSFQYFTSREYLSYVAASYQKPLPDISELVQGFHFEEYPDCLRKSCQQAI